MGSTLSKTIGTETIDKQTETVGGFHIVEVINKKSEKDEDYFCGVENYYLYNYFYSNFPFNQIHGATATYGLVSLVVGTILVYVVWRSCRRRMMKERSRNLTAAFQLTQSPTTRVPIFGRDQQDLPPRYPSPTSTGTDAPSPPKYDIQRMINSLV